MAFLYRSIQYVSIKRKTGEIAARTHRYEINFKHTEYILVFSLILYVSLVYIDTFDFKIVIRQNVMNVYVFCSNNKFTIYILIYLLYTWYTQIRYNTLWKNNVTHNVRKYMIMNLMVLRKKMRFLTRMFTWFSFQNRIIDPQIYMLNCEIMYLWNSLCFDADNFGPRTKNSDKSYVHYFMHLFAGKDSIKMLY